MPLALDGVRVVSLEQAVAAPLCTRHLADLGADVVKVERPEGDFARRYDSIVEGTSAYFVWLNRGKRSIALDLATPADRATFDALLGDADVFVHNLGPGAVERLGYGWGDAHARWPRLVWVCISGYGTDGPYRDRKAYDLLIQAEAALMSITGSPEASAKVGISLADIAGGVYGFSSVLAALRLRDRTGEGQRCEISLFDCLAEWMTVPLYYRMYGGWTLGRMGTRHNTIAPYGEYRCADGSVMLAVQNEKQWRAFCDVVIERPELIDDPRFRTNELRSRRRAELEAIVEEILASHARAEVEARLIAADVPFSTFNTVLELAEHPQLAARDRWVDVTTPTGTARAVRPPFETGTISARVGAVPGLDEHGAQIRRELEAKERR
ncbi:MAG: CoA transferase [Chloroflexota bacterium]|nr:CoA transferase [Chloroflexota bacterium]